MLKKIRKSMLALLVCLAMTGIVVNAARTSVYLSTTSTAATSGAIGLSKVCNFMGGNRSASRTSVYMYGQAAKPGSSFVNVRSLLIYPGQQNRYAATYNATDNIARNYRVALIVNGAGTGCSSSAEAYY